jgi:hypothetical protein
MLVPTYFREDCRCCGRALLALVETFGAEVVCSCCRQQVANGASATQRSLPEESRRAPASSPTYSPAQHCGAPGETNSLNHPTRRDPCPRRFPC